MGGACSSFAGLIDFGDERAQNGRGDIACDDSVPSVRWVHVVDEEVRILLWVAKVNPVEIGRLRHEHRVGVISNSFYDAVEAWGGHAWTGMIGFRSVRGQECSVAITGFRQARRQPMKGCGETRRAAGQALVRRERRGTAVSVIEFPSCRG